jgi:hypothetical protein
MVTSCLENETLVRITILHNISRIVNSCGTGLVALLNKGNITTAVLFNVSGIVLG